MTNTFNYIILMCQPTTHFYLIGTDKLQLKILRVGFRNRCLVWNVPTTNLGLLGKNRINNKIERWLSSNTTNHTILWMGFSLNTTNHTVLRNRNTVWLVVFEEKSVWYKQNPLFFERHTKPPFFFRKYKGRSRTSLKVLHLYVSPGAAALRVKTSPYERTNRPI